jgi:DNA polymerase type B, organellar and viral
MPKEFWTIDCETDPFLYGRIPEPFLWGAFNPTYGYFEFETSEELYKFMWDKKAIFYAHNGGKFDFHYISKYLNTNEKLLMINSRLVVGKIGKAEIRDSYALLPFPLRDIGNKIEIDYNKLEKNIRHKHMPEIKEYLKADCVELYNAIKIFFDEYGRHKTAAGAALKQLCKIEKLKIENQGSGFYEEFRHFYYGGRCECFYKGSIYEDFSYIDINSAYPFAMKHEHPSGSAYKVSYDKKPKIVGYGFYTVECISDGALPKRVKSGLKFPKNPEIDRYTVTGWELLAAIECNKLKNITHIEQKVFYETRNFSNFINTFWQKRQMYSKGTPENLFCKLMMNSAYGKFASNPENYETHVIFESDLTECLVEQGWSLKGDFGDTSIFSLPLEASEMRYYNVATGASITGFVRAMLIRGLSNVQEPLYCDTDSIIFRGSSSIELSEQLGSWGLEGVFNEGHFSGKKLYAVKNNKKEKIARKGTRLNFDELKAIANGEEIVYRQEAPVFSWNKNRILFTDNEDEKNKLFLSRKIKITS